jgi:hypothetical protein
MKATTLIALGTLLGTSAFVAAQDAPATPTRPARTPRAPSAEAIKEFDKTGILGLNAAFFLISPGFQPFSNFVAVATSPVS